MDEKYSMNTELDPEVEKVRDKIISKIGNKPLDKVISETTEKAPVQDQKEEKDIDKDEKWIRVVMLQSGDVNGKQIDKGVVLDVKEEDGLKLIEAKKAEIVVEKKPEVKEEKEEKEEKEDVKQKKRYKRGGKAGGR